LPRQYKTAAGKAEDAALRQRWCEGAYAAINARLRRMKISAAALQQAAGVGPDQIRKIGEGKVPSALTLARLARALRTTMDDLSSAAPPQFGLAEGPQELFVQQPTAVAVSSEAPPPEFLSIAPAPYGARLGGLPAATATLLPDFQVQAELLRHRLNGGANDFLWSDVDGSEMSPDLISGDRVLIDWRRRDPAFPGLYAIEAGQGLAARWLEPAMATEPQRYRVRCSDPRFPPYEVAGGELRVVGRIVWVSRYL